MNRSSLKLAGITLLMAMILGFAPEAGAQPNNPDPPMAFEEPAQPEPKDTNPFPDILQAICWYLPNRVADLFDIPAVYLTLGDGNGVSVRATRLISANYFEDSAMGIGWNPRGSFDDKRGKSLIFDESIHEQFFQFLFAWDGTVQRDPTEFGLSFHFVSVGANVGLSLGEFVDFALGFIGVDLYADDYGPTFNDRTGDDEMEF